MRTARVVAARARRAHPLAEHQPGGAARPGARPSRPRAAGRRRRTRPRRGRPVVPPTVVTQGLGCAAYSGAGVAGGGDDDHVGLGRAQQGALHRVDPGRPAHRQADHVDAVARGAVDRGDQVGGRAAVVGGVGGAPSTPCRPRSGPAAPSRRSAPAARRPPAPGRRRCRRRSRPSGCRGRRSRAGRGTRCCAGCPRRSRRRTTVRRRPCVAVVGVPAVTGLAAAARSRAAPPSGTAAANSGLSGPDAGVDRRRRRCPRRPRPGTLQADAPPTRHARRRRAGRTSFGSTRATSRRPPGSIGLRGGQPTANPLSAVGPAVRRLRRAHAIQRARILRSRMASPATDRSRARMPPVAGRAGAVEGDEIEPRVPRPAPRRRRRTPAAVPGRCPRAAPPSTPPRARHRAAAVASSPPPSRCKSSILTAATAATGQRYPQAPTLAACRSAAGRGVRPRHDADRHRARFRRCARGPRRRARRRVPGRGDDRAARAAAGPRCSPRTSPPSAVAAAGDRFRALYPELRDRAACPLLRGGRRGARRRTPARRPGRRGHRQVPRQRPAAHRPSRPRRRRPGGRGLGRRQGRRAPRARAPRSTSATTSTTSRARSRPARRASRCCTGGCTREELLAAGTHVVLDDLRRFPFVVGRARPSRLLRSRCGVRRAVQLEGSRPCPLAR